jgi:hypothetical protein
MLKLLPLLPSGPDGVHNRHVAQGLAIYITMANPDATNSNRIRNARSYDHPGRSTTSIIQNIGLQGKQLRASGTSYNGEGPENFKDPAPPIPVAALRPIFCRFTGDGWFWMQNY